jgi:hypothetical protein
MDAEPEEDVPEQIVEPLEGDVLPESQDAVERNWGRARSEGNVEPRHGDRVVEAAEVARDPDHGATSRGNKLYAKAIADGFASLGLFCSVLRPATREEVVSPSTVKLAKRADLVVIDWSIYKDDGATALDLIEQLLAPDADQDRYRVICVYTGAKALGDIARDIKARLDTCSPGFRSIDDGLTVVRGHTLVGVYAKEGTEVVAQDSGREVEAGDLAQRLVTDFAAVVKGLLANAVMKSLGEIRRYTHRILGKFDRGLDAPFITHRAMTSPPHEVEEQVVPLVVAEIEAVLDDQAVFETVSATTIDAYLRDVRSNGTQFTFIDADDDKALKILGELVRRGPVETKKIYDVEAVKWIIDAHKKFPQLVGKFTNALQGEDSEETSRDEKFSMLMNVRSRYASGQPVLAPGVIMAQQRLEETSYWLCAQPTCDCVRLAAPRRFLFLPLQATRDGRFDAVFLDGNQVKRLKLSKKLYEGEQFEFAPTNGAIEAVDRFGASVFVSTKLDLFRYVCRLKLEHGLRATERLSSNISRIGLTESEWFRANAPRE